MLNTLVATEKPFASAATVEIRKIIEENGYTVSFLEKYTQKDDLIKSVSGADALIVRSDKITREVLESAGRLKIIARAGAGYDNIDIITAKEKKIVVMNTPGQNSNAVAELTTGMMIYMARVCFKGASGTELKGKKLGIHAYGNVGKIVAHLAKAFGMEVFAYDPYIEEEEMKKDSVIKVDNAEELYKTCRYVSLHIPANNETKKSINYNLLSLMPAGATLVNTARKEVICEASLMRIFSERDDIKYITDVTPDCGAELEKFFPRYYSTPKKQGAETSEANINAGIAAARQIVNFFKSGDTTFQVNK